MSISAVNVDPVRVKGMDDFWLFPAGPIPLRTDPTQRGGLDCKTFSSTHLS